MTTTNQTPALPFSVNLWGSHPDAGNDDCDTGKDFATIEEAVAAFNDIGAMIKSWDAESERKGWARPSTYFADWVYAELTGPDGLQLVRRNPDERAIRRRKRDADECAEEWRREQAYQLGMAFGCDGYNEGMGY